MEELDNLNYLDSISYQWDNILCSTLLDMHAPLWFLTL
jgi:hypothetical protein